MSVKNKDKAPDWWIALQEKKKSLEDLKMKRIEEERIKKLEEEKRK